MSFHYYNANPLGKHEEDCVTRAICRASGMPYGEVKDKLYYTAQLLDCEKLCVCCYYHLLDYVLCYERMNDSGITVDEFCMRHPKGTYLLRISGHLTCVVDGDIEDIWDCGDKIVTHAWYVD